MPVSSAHPNRVALAPINMNVASPLQNFKSRQHNTHSSANANTHSNTNTNTNTSTSTKAMSHVANALPLAPSLTPKLGLIKSMSSLTPSCTRGASVQTKARKLESFSEYKISNSRNVKADLAATKLKLRLQLAFYKLKQNRDAAMASSPSFRVAKTRSVGLASRAHSFTSSANINLQKPKSATRAICLSTVASNKSASAEAEGGNDKQEPKDNGSLEKESPCLKLYHIKPSSAFYNAYSHRLPLTNTNAQRLPPVHKILRTPIKAASRALSHLGHSTGNTTFNATGNSTTTNSDETIDETMDETTNDPLKKKSDILGSSPIRHGSFGTPNRFSVAKSLLQLGSGFY
ncbi:hypothetical protein JCM33374_g5621 [Metschnikowia sp. JCM 33374]|nr:hypothetical protein JCM33374_g5621 [Metschnikowia sp. JCM 33374]